MSFCHLWLAGHWGCIPNGDHCLCGLGPLDRFLSNWILLKLKKKIKTSVEVAKATRGLLTIKKEEHQVLLIFQSGLAALPSLTKTLPVATAW